jgi:hypothetical protein
VTITTINPAVVASYSADDIKRQLVAGRTVQQVSDRTGWPRQRVTAIINGVKGWLLDPNSDTVYELSEEDEQIPPRLPANATPARRLEVTPEPVRTQATPIPQPAPDLEAEPKQPAALLALIARTLGMLSGFQDATVAKEIGRANTALVQLEEALTIGERRRQAEADLAAAEQAVADAKARLKQIKTGKAIGEGEPTAKQIRTWAAAEGIAVAPNGLIPASVRQQYDAAH